MMLVKPAMNSVNKAHVVSFIATLRIDNVPRQGTGAHCVSNLSKSGTISEARIQRSTC